MPFLLGYQMIENNHQSPTIGILRLALTCKKAKKIIEFFIDPHKLPNIAKYHAIDHMIDVFYTKPDWKDKVKENPKYRSIEFIWEHPIFGGSVLNPVQRLY
jgi:hypothetical protein